MTIAYDATTYSSTNPSFSHTAAAGAKGIIVCVQATDADATAVTWDGDSLSEVTASPISQSIGGTGSHTSLWFLGSGISTGTNTVSITGPTSGNCVAHAFTVTADDDIEEVDSDSVAAASAGVDPSVTMTLGSRSSFIIWGGATGVGNVANFDPLNSGDWTAEQELDVGSSTIVMYRRSAIVTANTECGLDQPNDSARFIAAAFAEVEAAGSDIIKVVPTGPWR